MSKEGVKLEVIEREGWVKVEKEIENEKEKLVGGMRMKKEEKGECLKLKNELEKIEEGMGVKLRLGVKIK